MSLAAKMFKRVANAEAAHERYYVLFALDVSGSMRAEDGVDRSKYKPGLPVEEQPKITRFAAALQDIRRYYTQLDPDCLGASLITFGERVQKFEFKNVAELDSILGRLKPNEGCTATDLAVAESNKDFTKFMSERAGPDAGPATHVTLYLTDGAPHRPGEKDEELKYKIAKLLIAGTAEMKTDKDRASVFLQYGVWEYGLNDKGEMSPASEFLAFLDDQLVDLMEAELTAQGVSPDKIDEIKGFDAVDTGKQCHSNKEHNPKKGGVEYDKPWDNSIQELVHAGVSD